MMHKVAVLAVPGVVGFDLTIPCELFFAARSSSGDPHYQVLVCGMTGDIDAGPFSIRCHGDFNDLVMADTVIVPGLRSTDTDQWPEAVSAVREAHANGARVASICSGAFILAAAGLLNGRRATTHWASAQQLAAQYPAITVDPRVLFIDEESVLTSAGLSAGIDLILHIIRRDHGQAVAVSVARYMVAPMERTGGQAQFIHYAAPAATDNLAPLLSWMAEHVDELLTVAGIARRANMSERTLARRFREQTGTTPLQWLLAERTRQAQSLLETTTLSIDAIAARTGFDKAASLRSRFRRLVGVSPSTYRSTFNPRNET